MNEKSTSNSRSRKKCSSGISCSSVVTISLSCFPLLLFSICPPPVLSALPFNYTMFFGDFQAIHETASGYGGRPNLPRISLTLSTRPIPIFVFLGYHSVKITKMGKWIDNFEIYKRPPNCIRTASKVLCLLNLESSPFPWEWLYAPNKDLCEFHLNGADLSYADFEHAFLKRAQLRGANLSGAYLKKARLLGADLRDTDLSLVSGIRRAYIDEHTRFDPGVRMKYFGIEEPEHPDE